MLKIQVLEAEHETRRGVYGTRRAWSPRGQKTAQYVTSFAPLRLEMLGRLRGSPPVPRMRLSGRNMGETTADCSFLGDSLDDYMSNGSTLDLSIQGTVTTKDHRSSVHSLSTTDKRLTQLRKNYRRTNCSARFYPSSFGRERVSTRIFTSVPMSEVVRSPRSNRFPKLRPNLLRSDPSLIQSIEILGIQILPTVRS